MTTIDDENDPEFLEALQRSLQVTNLEEAMLAKALADSISTRDEEIARNLQREQLLMLEKSLCDEAQDTDNAPPNSTAPETQPQLTNRGAHVPSQSSQPNSAIGDEELARALQREESRLFSEGVCEVIDPSTFTTVQYRKKNRSTRGQTGSCDPLHESRHCVAEAQPSPSSSQRQTPQRRFYVHRQTSPDAEKRRRLDSIVEGGDRPHTAYATASSASGSSKEHSSAPVVVIDGQNVGHTYGGSNGNIRNFRAEGIEVVLDYYAAKGMKAVAMLPKRIGAPDAPDADAAAIANRLADEGRLSFTPSGAHDDYFLLAYAKQKDIDIVSNDRFRKEIKQQETTAASRALQNFLNRHLIPYTFVNGEFLPNPNPRQLSRAEHCKRDSRYTRRE